MDMTYHLIHMSGDTFMPLAATQDDVERAWRRGPDLLVLTETGENSTVQGIKDVIGKTGTVVNPDRGDICFVIRKGITVTDAGGPLAIPGVPGPAAQGGHGPRHNSYVTQNFFGEHISHTAVHLVTAHSHHAHGGPSRTDEQLKQAQLMAKQVQALGRGHALSTGSGDLNTVLPADKAMQAIFDNHELTTTAEEAENTMPTHGSRRIDYVWTYDGDRRLYVQNMRVLSGRQWLSDHDAVEVFFGIKPKR
jgi:hypothetical protein